jgi:hypothetical protein
MIHSVSAFIYWQEDEKCNLSHGIWGKLAGGEAGNAERGGIFLRTGCAGRAGGCDGGLGRGSKNHHLGRGLEGVSVGVHVEIQIEVMLCFLLTLPSFSRLPDRIYIYIIYKRPQTRAAAAALECCAILRSV